jgi:hypothetical protein
MLSIKRRKVESKLIKLRILLKLHENKPLTSAELNYQREWIKALKSATISGI